MSGEEVRVKVEEDSDTNKEADVDDVAVTFEAQVEFSVLKSEVKEEITDVTGGDVGSCDADSADNKPLASEQAVNEFFGSTPRWLHNSKWDRRDSIGKKKFVFIDLSGTLHIENTATRDAVQALKLLRQNGFKVLFLTNTTKESRAKIHQRLVEIGFTVKLEEIYTSLNSTRRYVEKNNLRPFFMVAEEAMEDFQGIPTDNPNAVLIGLSSAHFNYDCMNKAWRLLSLPETQLLAIHKGRELKVSDGWNLGPGPFVYALETASQKKAIVLGKPEPEFFASAMQYVGCEDVLDAVMIGDDVRDDVLGAMTIGMTGIWVQTGKSTTLDKIKPHEPDFAVADFADAVALILDKSSDTAPILGNRTALRVMAEGLKYKPSKSDNLLFLR